MDPDELALDEDPDELAALDIDPDELPALVEFTVVAIVVVVNITEAFPAAELALVVDAVLAPLSFAFLLTFEVDAAEVVIDAELEPLSDESAAGVVVVTSPPPIFLVVLEPTAVGVVPAPAGVVPAPFCPLCPGPRVVERFPAIRFSEAMNC